MRAACALLFVASIGLPSRSPAQSLPTSVSIFGTYTTASKLFHHPSAADELLRGSYLPLDNILSGGFEVRRSIEPLRITIGLSAEMITTSTDFSLPVDSVHSLSGTDGYWAVPVELSGYFTIPVGNDALRFYMGGGGGMYTGARRYTYAGASAPAVSRKPGFGIHVTTGFEYEFLPNLALRGELKFRDIQFETSNRFESASATQDGVSVGLDQEPFTSRIHIDGMTLNLGLAVSIPP